MAELRTAVFRKQHEGIVEIVDTILTSLDSDGLKNNSHGIRKLLTKLSHNVKIHLILEDTALYPILANSDDDNVKETSRQYMEEMGIISESYNSYVEKWSSGSGIKENTAGFIDETKDLLGALLNRIDRENNGLYQIIDKL